MTDTTPAAIEALLQGAEWQEPESLRRYLFPTFSALASERDAALRERDEALLREAALLANNEAERKTLVAHNARHAAEAAALRGEVDRLRAGIAVLAAHPEDEGCHMCGDFMDFYRDQCNYAARLLTALTSKGGEG